MRSSGRADGRPRKQTEQASPIMAPVIGSDERVETAVVFAGGDAVDPGRFAPLPDALLVAADGGLAQALALGVHVDVVVGDMDSVDLADLDRAVAAGATVVRHPRKKDATDLELALTYVKGKGCRRAIVIGGLGGRIDHFLGNALLLASPVLTGMDVRWLTGNEVLAVVRSGEDLTTPCEPGQIVSLLPLGGPVAGVHTSGLAWPLAGETLLPFSTRGVSNETTEPSFSVAVEAGALLVVHRITPASPQPA